MANSNDTKDSRGAEALAELNSSLESIRRKLRAADSTSAFAIRLGASNPPFDCEIFSPDYRLRLPEKDPVRTSAKNLREYGSKASLETMAAAHNACLVALGVAEPDSP